MGAPICDSKMEAGAATTVSGGDRLHLERDLELASSSDELVDKNLAFIIGSAKCATTSLWYYLSQHPEVFGHPLKETKFFYRGENDGLSGEQIHRAYLDIYQQTNDPKLTTAKTLLEATPGNFFNPKAARRIAAACPNAKLLIIVRDPVKRAFSEWQMRHRTDAEDPPVELFTEDVDRDIARLHNSRHDGTLDWDQYLEGFDLDDPKGRASMQPLIGRGMYLDQLHMWMKYFPRDRFFFLHIADLDKKRIRTHLRDIAAFLGIDPSFEWPEEVLDEKMNKGGNGFSLNTMASSHRYKVSREMGEETRARLYQFFEPHNWRFFKEIGRDLDWTKPPSVPTPTPAPTPTPTLSSLSPSAACSS